MNLVLNIAVIFTALAACFTTPNAAPAGKVNTLSNTFTALTEGDSVQDPGIADWFTKRFNDLLKVFSDLVADGNPEHVEKVRNYIQKYRAIVGPIATFIKQYYPNDVVANNIMSAINTYLSQLDQKVNGNTADHQAYVQNLAYLMRELENMN